MIDVDSCVLEAGMATCDERGYGRVERIGEAPKGLNPNRRIFVVYDDGSDDYYAEVDLVAVERPVSARRYSKHERVVDMSRRLNEQGWHNVDPATLPETAHEIMDQILSRKKVADKWAGSRYEKIKNIAIGDRGDAGEELVLSYARKRGSNASKDGRLGDHDVVVPLKHTEPRLEVKLATEGATSGSFQFNGIRTDKDYDVLLLLAVSPNTIRIQAWSHADVCAGKAGTLTPMSKRNKTDHKIAKPAKQVKSWASIEDLLTVLEATKF